MADAEPLMELAVMRMLLKRSSKKPLNCAVGIGPNDVGLLLLHRRKHPKVLAKTLKADVPEAKGTRWGIAWVDPATNPKLVKLALNRAAPGLARRLIRTLKGTGFNGVDAGMGNTPEPPDKV